ncbi:MAG: flagellar biosynthesis protein FlhB [Treponema sp. GWB1_62_6]|nr:MAG: flagellar biosynthesis protein FlhB [Treponema sp. GWC1_61_84]OHE65161.1 MAG: flagellar biosynthesis protein FlhB [Treponema sp. GWA1_62_8]OHE72057.1 MAG: flagellar biosynthesis protein FlhB [Treponema sp. GWB1_62_6]HCM27960.1 flagellar biosynthesis protein FlhB [Treponema sp.]
MRSFADELALQQALLMDLQWFAAEDEGRTEEPSEYKIRKAREEGRVPKSQELVGALVLLMPALAILFLAKTMLKTCVEMVRFFLERAVELDPTKDPIVARAFFSYFIKLALPIMLVAVFTAVFANVVQTGFLFTTKPLTPNFSKILPRFGKYFQRTLFSMEGLFNFAKSVLKMAIIGIVAFIIIRGEIVRLANLQTASLWSSVTLVSSLAMRLLIVAALLLLALSVPDLFFQRWQYTESLKMTKQEVKEERKMYEGDPLIKGRLRQRMRELLSRNMAANVPKADVVITNPTHFAVALEWNRESMSAPVVTAKGADEVAFRIRRIAEDSGVPVVENRPLARALFAETEIGDAIPEQYYQAIAVVLAHVYKMDESRGGKAAAGA